jgi:hypothetical protein
MGLLDDAIREHLDLKRRRGADPTEVEREEREVLGAGHPRAPEAGAGTEVHEFEPLADEEEISWANGGSEHATGSGYATGEAEPGPAAAAFDHELAAEPEPYAPPAVAREPDPYAPPPVAREPDPYAGPGGDEPHDTGPSTVEYSVEEVEEEGPSVEGEREDVLEETPEFLQDTPDHDRLWFEQRPPRDFDFDG